MLFVNGPIFISQPGVLIPGREQNDWHGGNQQEADEKDELQTTPFRRAIAASKEIHECCSD
ncbi:MAG: hypothetical protein HOM07_02425 [Rhodospirillaceae bacterium]|nr:hypothetical protein [Rhodospirillaceae bacterium]